MPIQMTRIIENGEYVSAITVVCDACGKDIDKASRAWYVWFYESLEVGSRTPVYFAHKGKCIDRIEATHGQPMWSGELIEFPTFLARNIGIDTNKPFPLTLSAG